MATNGKKSRDGSLYERRIGTPTTNDEVNGYWLFGFGVLLGLAGVAAFLLTERATTVRGVGYALAALAPPFIMLGAVIRFPLRRAGTYLGYLGTAVTVLGVVWFVNVFLDGWSTATGETTIIAVYGVGLFLIGLAGTVVPLLSDPVYEDYERMRGEVAAATATAEETDAELAPAREELATTESELDAACEELAETESELGAAREELAETETELEAAREDVTTAEAAAASLRESKARFELFEDAGGKPRWRLRHRNGNVIADSGERYASRSNAVEAVTRVKANAPGAETVEQWNETERPVRAFFLRFRPPPTASAAGRARRPRT